MKARHRNGNRKQKKGDNDDPVNSSSSMDMEERRLRRSLRKAEKVARQLAALGLDENGDELDNFSLVTYPVREWTFKIPGMPGSQGNEVACNPVVTVIAVAWLWGVVIWCSVDATNALAKLHEWRSMISLAFTWLIHGTKVIYLVFLLVVVYKYGNIKLGRKDDKAEFSNISYLCMIFAAGASNSIMAYSVYEPLSMRTDHFYAQSGYRTQDEMDMFAINVTVTDWGFGGWAPYALCAIAMSLAAHRYKLPLTFRSCFYPILGQYTWGWMGDAIDGFVIVATLANVFTNVGMVARNFVVGFAQMRWINDGSASADQTVVLIQNVVVWILSIVSLVAVLSGLHGGIRMCCIAALGLYAFLLLFALSLEDTKYLLNLQVQEVGVYLQTSLLQLNFWTDAFGQLREGSGRAVDGKAADQLWYCDWFNFAQLWWVVAGPVNGQFISFISRGRRIWEVVLYSLVAPVVLALVWFCTLGGIGMRQLRQAMELQVLGEKFYNNSAHFITDGSDLCYDVPQQDLSIDGVAVFTNHMPGITPVCLYDAEQSDLAIYNVLNSFSFPRIFKSGGFGAALSVVFMMASALGYMAAAGSASLVVDKMASSGRKNNHLARRMFWLVTVGALATGLLSTGGADGISAIQTGIVICGLPCTILLCFLLQSVTLMCQQSMEQEEVGHYQLPNQVEFTMPVYGGIFNIVEFIASRGKVNPARVELGMGNVSAAQLVEFAKGIFVPFVSLWQVLNSTYPQNNKNNHALAALYAAVYVAMLCCCIVPIKWPELQGLTWMFLIIHGGLLASVRASFRARFQIRSNMIADLVASTIVLASSTVTNESPSPRGRGGGTQFATSGPHSHQHQCYSRFQADSQTP